MNFAPYICIFVSLEINDSFLGKNYDMTTKCLLLC